MPFEKDELDNAIKQYKLDDLLCLIGNKSQEMFMKKVPFEWLTWKRGAYDTLKQLMPVWGLAELSHRAIINSNDHRSKRPTWEDLCKLNNLLAKVTDDYSRNRRNKTNEEARITVFFGIPAEQLWWQDMVRGGKYAYYNFIRYYLLLKEMPKYFPDLRKPEDDLMEITGFGMEDFSKLMLVFHAWGTMANSEVTLKGFNKEITEAEPILTEENLNKCLTHFSGNYDYYKKEEHPNNPLFFKPIIQTSNKRFIISNTFLMTRKFYEGIYWIIRDKYFNLKSQDFTNAFGKYYEKYIEELLGYYLKSKDFEKLDNQQGGADWLIRTNKYVLIVEQKSSLMSVALKRHYPSLNKFEQYLGGFKEASIQLEKTRKQIGIGDKKVIRLILHFESLFLKEKYIKPEIIRMLNSEIDLSMLYLIDTYEFERLIQTLSKDQSVFDDIINDKIECENSAVSPADGLDFDYIIQKRIGWEETDFLEKYRFVFDSLFKEIRSKNKSSN